MAKTKEKGVVGFIHNLERVERMLAVILFNLVLFCLFWQAFTRKINHPASWTEEMSRLLFVYMGALGVHIAQKENNHVRIDAILLSLPRKVQLGIEAFTNICMVGIFGMIFYYTFGIVQRKTYTPLVTLGIGESWLYAAMFVLCVLQVIEMIAQLVLIFSKGKVTRDLLPEDKEAEAFYEIEDLKEEN